LLPCSVDIDDIEDFELDDGGLVEDLLHDDLGEPSVDLSVEGGSKEPVVVGLVAASAAGGATVNMAKMAAPIERERKRGSFATASPDLAYGSLNPSMGDF
jgi:hypothetical protein